MGKLWLVVHAMALASFCDASCAHAFLEQSDPRVGSTVRAAPRAVELQFSQDLEPAFSTVVITDASGQRVEAGEPIISRNVIRIPLRELGAGRYRVDWRVLSVDTHATQGAFNFEVQKQ